ncbi:MAG: 1-deoxy-D-xylulose-5-phosphate reductoisomerase [Congregibacter sp.]
MRDKRESVVILGSTGSIGESTLDVLSRHPQRYEVHALAARRSVDALFDQCLRYRPRYALMAEHDAAQALQERIRTSHEALATEVLAGPEALIEMAAHADVDVVVAAIVGAVGMPSALAAAQSGKRILLANKEALVTAGGLFMAAVEEGHATLLPVDSEHNAIFQCLPADARARPQLDGVAGLILTASGGPFRGRDQAFLETVTPEQACAHPNWDMGRKISVDSASLMNKGLELAEACWLFGVPESRVEVVVHPQSIVHSLVRYNDGSVLAQLGEPDMRTPIGCCLAWPGRIDAGVKHLDLLQVGRLDFEEPDMQRFPCLRIARECISAGGTAMAIANAANEEAVAGFLSGQLSFCDIAAIIEEALAALPAIEPRSLAEVEVVDGEARVLARQFMSNKRFSIAQSNLDGAGDRAGAFGS